MTLTLNFRLNDSILKGVSGQHAVKLLQRITLLMPVVCYLDMNINLESQLLTHTETQMLQNQKIQLLLKLIRNWTQSLEAIELLDILDL